MDKIIEELAIKCGIRNEQDGYSPTLKKKGKYITYTFNLNQLEAFVNELTKPSANCEICKGTGQYCIGTSNDESDGNAPILERFECYLDNELTKPQEAVADDSQENVLRISKSGYSVKVGWKDKRIVASAPNNVCDAQWIEDAQKLCDGWNSIPNYEALQKENERLLEALETLIDYAEELKAEWHWRKHEIAGNAEIYQCLVNDIISAREALAKDNHDR